MNLVSLVYASKVTKQLHHDGVIDIVNRARPNNEKLDVTGILCFDNNYFLQCLEGPRCAVNQLYSKILIDPRHADIMLLEYAEINTRRFMHWDMGLALPTKTRRPIFLKHSVSKTFNPFSMSGISARQLLVDLYAENEISSKV